MSRFNRPAALPRISRLSWLMGLYGENFERAESLFNTAALKAGHYRSLGHDGLATIFAPTFRAVDHRLPLHYRDRHAIKRLVWLAARSAGGGVTGNHSNGPTLPPHGVRRPSVVARSLACPAIHAIGAQRRRAGQAFQNRQAIQFPTESFETYALLVCAAESSRAPTACQNNR